MFNFLRKNLSEKQMDSAQTEQAEPEPAETQFESAAIKPEASSVLDDLREYLAIKKDLGADITPQEVEQVTGMKMEQLADFLNEQKVNFATTGAQLTEVIQSALAGTEGEAGKGVMRKLAEDPKVRAAFVALILFLKFTPSAEAAHSDKIADKQDFNKEVSASFGNNIEPDNTYHASFSDFHDGTEKKTGGDAKALNSNIIDQERFSAIDLANYFDTDSDHISAAAEAKIAADFQGFLSHLDSSNIDDILDADLNLYGSSDERLTTKWQGGNEALTQARLVAAEKILNKTLQAYPFSDLPADKVEQLKAKGFVLTMAESTTGPEKGVTYVTDLQNPETGINYTADEAEAIKINNPGQYKELLDDCRQIKFQAVAKKVIEMEKIGTKKAALKPAPKVEMAEKEAVLPILERLNEYQNVNIGSDVSASMQDTYKYLSEKLAKSDIESVKLTMSTFSNKVHSKTEFSSAVEAAQTLAGTKFIGSSNERALDAAYKDVKEMKSAAGHNLELVMTDESFQGMSWQKLIDLKTLADKNNTDVYFYFTVDSDQTVREINLAELTEAFKNELWNTAMPKVNFLMKQYENKINELAKIQKVQSERIKALSERDLGPDAKKTYQEAQKKVAEATAGISEYQSQLEALRSDWESGSAERLFANKDVDKEVSIGQSGSGMDKNLKRNVKGEDLGRTVYHIGEIEKG